MRNILSVAIGLLVISCGGDDIDSVSKFIGKAHNSPASHEVEDYQLGGDLEDAFLINKVLIDDHLSDPSQGARDPTSVESKADCYGNNNCNLTVRINVAYTSTSRTGTDDCSSGLTLADGKCHCIAPTEARAAVTNAMRMWLAPLSDYSGEGNLAIISAPSYSGDGSDFLKVYPDLIVNFSCSAITVNAITFPADDAADGCPTGTTASAGESCTRYHAGTHESPENSGKIVELDTNPSVLSESTRNIPIIYIGEAGSNTPTRDAIGRHDRLDLLHELGHAFGLDKAEGGEQPKTAIMAGHRHIKNRQLVLHQDDEAGVRWLFEHHRRRRPLSVCGADYTSGSGGCHPKHPLVTALRKLRAGDALKLVEDYPEEEINLNAQEANTLSPPCILQSGTSTTHLFLIKIGILTSGLSTGCSTETRHASIFSQTSRTAPNKHRCT